MKSMIRCIVLAFAAVVLLLGTTSAVADTILNYQISGPDSFGASFTLPQNPTRGGGNQLAFYFASLPVDVNGAWTNLTVDFYSALFGGGVLGSNTFDLCGRQLFSWADSSSTPTMDPGTFYTIGVAAGRDRGFTRTLFRPSRSQPPISFWERVYLHYLVSISGDALPDFANLRCHKVFWAIIATPFKRGRVTWCR